MRHEHPSPVPSSHPSRTQGAELRFNLAHPHVEWLAAMRGRIVACEVAGKSPSHPEGARLAHPLTKDERRVVRVALRRIRHLFLRQEATNSDLSFDREEADALLTLVEVYLDADAADDEGDEENPVAIHEVLAIRNLGDPAIRALEARCLGLESRNEGNPRGLREELRRPRKV